MNSKKHSSQLAARFRPWRLRCRQKAAFNSAKILAYRWLLLVAVAVLAADQLTKAWIATRLPFGTTSESEGAIPVIRGFFYLVHVGNTGAAWSLFTGRSPVLAVFAVATLVAIFIWRRALGLRDAGIQVCFGLLCGGILGNLTDRLVHHYVVDFIDLHFGAYHYPTFNVADSGICVGVALYFIFSLRSHGNGGEAGSKS